MRALRTLLAALCTLGQLAVPVAAQSALNSPPVTISDPKDPNVPDDPKEKPVCRRETVTGSRLAGRRICKTRAQWKAEADETRESVDGLQRGSRNTQRVPR